ncbi:DUF5681 domain-containing protein [Thiorhodovibrio frisius]|uniref:DUF5681 domain-containing protein n=1 Tax=Thiorhodovibrio frisius TaxID=631362 RepID=H8Z5G2_9GAMM|nr:DUF5681 domain-containing protein [Thiorhodovibrio frisius]EIC19508.1 hypothetical protein Thi970DRAFT_03086 [Thiorhodovibrio frisius]WPL20529.1 hypothetical protein Thiofri_00628 [Thiorhodovibrio frisius]
MARFEKGKSGNPGGRPRGIVNFAKLRKAIADDVPEILEAMVAAAKGGDVAAAKLLLDRALPPLKPTAPAVSIPLSGDPADSYQRILAAAGKGQIPVDTALALAQLVAATPEQAQDLSFPNIEKLDAMYAAAQEHAEREKARVDREIAEGKRGGMPKRTELTEPEPEAW